MEWKWIDNYENIYKIYINGDVESFVFKKTKILKSRLINKGYLQIGLKPKGEKRKFFLIHRLIAIAFIPNPDNKPNIDHINGDRTNNSIGNLRWVNKSENMLNVKNYGKYKKGVYYNKHNKIFVAKIHINKKQIHLGYFKTEDEAHEVYKAKFFEHHGYECCSR